jgi:predicted aspartyl protease
MLGIFNKNDQPIIEVEIKGFGGAAKKINALIDSGFNGYIQIPFVEALPLGLILAGVEANTLADGSTSSHLVCKGQVCVDGKCIDTTIDIEAANIVLLGTKLLKELNKTFILNCAEGKVEITENTQIDNNQHA